MMLRRRGRPGSRARNLWDRVLLVALELDDLAGSPSDAAQRVPPLATKVRDLLARLPESQQPPRLAPLFWLAEEDDDASDAAAFQSALGDWLRETAQSLARLAGAPVARNPDDLARQATDVLRGLAPLLDAWTTRLAAAPTVQAQVLHLPAVRETDDRY